MTTDSSLNEDNDSRMSCLDNMVFRHIPVGLCFFDSNGVLLEINNACLDVFGISDISSIKKLNLFTVFNLSEEFIDTLQNGGSLRFERKLDFADLRIRSIIETKRNTVIDMAVFLEPLVNELKNVCGILCMVQDITRQVKEKEQLRSSEERWQFAIEGAGSGLWDWDFVSNRVFFSRQWKATIGYEDYEIGNTSDEWEKRVHPEDLGKAYAELNRHLSGENPIYQADFRMLCKDGTYKWIHARGKVVARTDDGKPLRIIGTHTDVTEKYKMMEDLYEREVIYKNLFDHHIAVKLIIDPSDGSIIDANNAAADFYGWPCEKLKSMKIQEINIISDDLVKSEVSNVVTNKKMHFEFRHRISDGSVRDVEVFSSRIESGGKPYIHSIVHDITLRKQHEEEIKLDEARLESLLRINQHSTEDVQALLDFVLNEAINLTGSEIGYLYFYDEDRQEFTLNSWSHDVMKECKVRDPVNVYKLEKTGIWGEAVRQRCPIMINDFAAENPLKKGFPPGHVPLLKFLTIPVFSEKSIVAVIGVANKENDYNDADIRQLTLIMDTVWMAVERKNADEKRKLLVDMLDNAPNSIVIYDSEGRFLYANQKTFTLYGYSKDEFMQLNLHKIDAPESYEMVEERDRIIEKNGEASFELWHYNKSGAPFPVEVFIKKVIWAEKPAFLSIATDISSRKISELEQERLNKQLNQMQKLKSLGVLAGGIAHDFNNLLGGIFGYIEIARESTQETDVVDYLSKASGAIDRARRLTQQLLTFAKGGAPVKQVGHLFPFVEDTARFTLSGSSVSIDFDVQKNLWTCDFDRNQIGQVVENIVINALQAMPDGGSLHVIAENISINNGILTGLSAGDYVRISFRDTGVGIPDEILSRIFDPFFTTKPMGHGLGLATSFSIVSRHGGCIDVRSDHGRGSTFDIYLPASKTVSPINKLDTPSKLPVCGRVILMDDEDVILETTGALLRAMGFDVVCKKNGREVIEYFISELKANRPISAMIFDLTIPGGMGGKEAICEIRKLSQDVPVFVASGYADDPVMARPKDFGFTASICKPFSRNELAAMLGVVET